MTLNEWIRNGNCGISNYTMGNLCCELNLRVKDIREMELSDIYATRWGIVAKREHDRWINEGRYIEPKKNK